MNDNIYDNFEQESLSNITDNLSQNNNKINFEDLHRRFNDKRENITESNSDKFVHQTHSSEPEKKNDKKQNFMDFENNNNILSNLQNEIKFDKFENNPMSNILNEFNNENNNQFNNENILMNNYNNYEFNRRNVKEKRDLDFNNGNNIINDNNNNFEFNRKNIPLNNNIEFESNIFDNNNDFFNELIKHAIIVSEDGKYKFSYVGLIIIGKKYNLLIKYYIIIANSQ